MGTFEIFKDNNDKFRWEFRENSGKVIAESAESYSSRVICLSTIHLVKIEAITAEVADRSQKPVVTKVMAG